MPASTPLLNNTEPSQDELYEAEYKLQNCIRITLQVEVYTTEVYTGRRWLPVTEYVLALIADRDTKREISYLQRLINELELIRQLSSETEDVKTHQILQTVGLGYINNRIAQVKTALKLEREDLTNPNQQTGEK